MSFAKVFSAQVHYLGGRIVDVEVDLSRGLHSFSVVGLPDKAVEESRDRISAAIKNSGFESPKHKNQKVVISLAPAHLRKEGSVFDLAMALGYLLAAGDISFDPAGKLFLGELSLDGELRGTTGVLPIVIEARKKGFREIFLPLSRASEAALVEGMIVYGADTLSEVIDHLNVRGRKGDKGARKIKPSPNINIESADQEIQTDHDSFDEIKGQELAKRGLAIAASGGHNVLLYGPPGTGKTMLARSFRMLLPRLNPEQALEVTSIHSAAGHLSKTIITDPPFRSPHHTSSHVSIIGGGNIPRPGEITLAHRGVLFLDEFPEFERRVIEVLRQPLEEKVITVSRARGSVCFPANIIFIATMNPCPCGHFGNTYRNCLCSPTEVTRYRRKISGPIADRIDLWIEVGPIEYEKLEDLSDLSNTKESSLSRSGFLKLKEAVRQTRQIQTDRFKHSHKNYSTNSDIAAGDLPIYAPLSEKAEAVLRSAAKSLSLSMRSYHRVWKISKTIADLEGKTDIEEAHVLEALQYRPPREPGE